MNETLSTLEEVRVNLLSALEADPKNEQVAQAYRLVVAEIARIEADE